MSLREFIVGIRWGDTNWRVVRRRANGGVNTPPLLETPTVASNATPPPSVASTTKTRLRVEPQHGVQRRRHPNRTHLLKQARWISSEAAKGGGEGTR